MAAAGGLNCCVKRTRLFFIYKKITRRIHVPRVRATRTRRGFFKNLADTAGGARTPDVTHKIRHYKQASLRSQPVVIFEICASAAIRLFFNTASRAPYTFKKYMES
jgi:hypothetical protein